MAHQVAAHPFIHPSQTAKKQDFFYAHEIVDGDAAPLEKQNVLKQVSNSFTDEEDSEEDIEMGQSENLEDEPVVCNETDEDSHLHLRLPVRCKNGIHRTVDAHCAICCSGYEEDDNVVWSGLECKHAFHNECILPWLSKGKKRCPICRHWFVPGARIDDQKKALEAQVRRGASMSSDEDASIEMQQHEDQLSTGLDGSEQEAPVAEVDDQPTLDGPEGQDGSEQPSAEAEVDEQPYSEPMACPQSADLQTVGSKADEFSKQDDCVSDDASAQEEQEDDCDSNEASTQGEQEHEA